MKTLLSILFLGHLFMLTGQNRCGVDARYFKKFNTSDAVFESWLKEKKAPPLSTAQHLNQSTAPVQIPIVVHIIHQGEAIGSGLNLSDSIILQQIEILNQDFRRRNADTVLTPSIFRNAAADTEIEFVLAKRDPEGLPTNGIVRVAGSLNGYRYSDLSNQSDEYVLKSESQWPTDQYLNIYVTDILNGFIGYAQFPFVNLAGVDDPNYDSFLDGVVIDYKYFGVNTNTGGSFESYGRTLTHEMGHFFGLRHIWGDNSTCSEDDFCDDTPEQTSSYISQCPESSPSSCGSPDMYSNYLNYTNDACMNVFSNCQAQRMQTVIRNSPRVNTLITSPALKEPVVTTNDLGIRTLISPSSALCDNDVYPVVEVRNYGSNLISNGTVGLFVNETLRQTLALPSQLNALQTQILNFDPLTFSSIDSLKISFEVLSVNNVTDQNPENDTASILPIPYRSTALPYSNSFDQASSLLSISSKVTTHSNWIIRNAPFQTVANEAAFINFSTDEQLGTESTFLTDVFDLTALNAASFNFSYSYHVSQSTITSDQLSVLVSLDCGKTFDQRQPLFRLTGSNLLTSDGFPLGPDDWERVELNISQYAGNEGVRFAFTGLHGSGGALFIDSLTLESSDLKAYDVGISSIENLPIVSCFSSVNPALTIKNYGFETIDQITVQFDFNGNTESIIEDGIQLVPGAETTLNYPFSRLPDGEYKIDFTVSAPNDSTDQEESNNTISYTFLIDNQINILPVRNNFESPADWLINTPSDTSIWDTATLANGNTSLVAAAFENTKLGVQHWFISPLLDITAFDSASMSFRYAYQQRQNRNDRLTVYASDNCGANFSSILFDQESSALSVGSSDAPFIASNDEDWQTVFLDLSPYTGSDQVRIAFVFENGNGNNLYIDDIEFYQSSNPNIQRFDEQVTIYPNPVSTQLYFSMNLANNQPITIQLVDMTGKIVRTKRVENALNQEVIVSTKDLFGYYLLTWEATDTAGSKMIFINN